MAEPRPEVSVVIPALNAEAVLGDQLKALSAQEWERSWEVLVADNGSRDGTANLARSFSDRLPIRVVAALEEQTRAAACNAGVAASMGELLLFLDADDVAETAYVCAMADALREHQFVAARLDCDSLNPGWIRQVRLPAQVRGLGEGAYPYGYGGTLGLRRSVWDQFEGFDSGLRAAEDIDFCYRLAQAGVELRFVPEAVLRYRFRSTFSGIWRQAYSYGVSAAEIQHRYQKGFGPTEVGPRSLRELAGSARLVITSRNKGSLARMLYVAANCLGGLKGRLRPR